MTAPNAPAGLAAEEGDGEVTLSWTDPNNSSIIKYQVRQSDDGGANWGDWADISGSDSTTTTHTVAGLTNGTTYDFEVRAMNAGGYSAAASTSARPHINAAPVIGDRPLGDVFDVAENATPAVIKAVWATDVDDDSITWLLEGTDKDSFDLNIPGGGLAQLILASGTTLNYEVKNEYSVTLKASDGKGGSDSVAITVRVTDDNTEAPGKPDAPTVSSTTTTSVTIAGSAPSINGPAIDDYDVQYKLSSAGGWTEWEPDDDSTALTATITSLAASVASTSYDVQVRTENAEGTGPWSDSATATTPANNAPVISDVEATLGLDVSENSKGIISTCNASDAEGDAITWSLTGADAGSFTIGSSNGRLSVGSGTTLNHESGKTSYSFTVTASDDKGGSDSVAITLTVTNVEPPSAPSVSAASSSSLRVSWNTPGGDAPTDYDV